ncbi:hypothetical protein [uncultured Kordia sp.]|uniref:hypothetical protein n=1 Tax=uncultured Kordia sp. TaxID=507699 RepID=UPI00260D10ED|nr:hypothetical protein [uncultured Kordia sp.]
MEKLSKPLVEGKDYNVHIAAENVEPLKDEFIEEGSLGPFLRISSVKDKNIIYLYVYFHNEIKKGDYTVYEVTNEANPDLYEIEIDVKNRLYEPTKPQNLWMFIIKSSVDLQKGRVVLCNVNFNYIKPDTENNISKPYDVGNPKRGTKVIIHRNENET